MTIGTTALSGMAAAHQQRQQHKAIVDAYETRQEQEQQAATQKAFERSRQARRERARMTAMADASGVGGQSVDMQIADSRFQEGHDRSSIRTNRNMSMQANRTQAQSQQAQVGHPGLTMIQTGLNIGTTYAQDERTFQGS